MFGIYSNSIQVEQDLLQDWVVFFLAYRIYSVDQASAGRLADDSTIGYNEEHETDSHPLPTQENPADAGRCRAGVGGICV